MNDIEEKLAEYDLLGCFPRNEVGGKLAEQALLAWRAAQGVDAKETVSSEASKVANYAAHVFRANAYFRDGDMAEWFALPELGLPEIVRRWQRLRDEWEAARLEVSEEDEWAAEAEAERIGRLEDDGAYGRTLPYDEESERWIYIRFGGRPQEGPSRFGLAGEDTEDGPDPWRAETGGMTHEAGVSVFRAYRHPDVDGAYVLMCPAFDLARYGVPDSETHLLSVFPRAKPGDTGTAFRVDGSLATVRARDKTSRCELGSDGEYLIDWKKPCSFQPVELVSVWFSETETLPAFLSRRRFHERWEDCEQDSPRSLSV